MNDLQIFNNDQFGQVRTAILNNEPYFMLSDVCRILEIKNHNDAKSRLNKNGVGITDTIDRMGRHQEATFINESNLYKLAFTSRKKEAEAFTDWVTGEVLPTIRKHGAYMTEDTIKQAIQSPDFLIQLATELKDEQERRKQAEMIVAQQEQQIAEFQPIKDYVDEILSSTSTLTTTQVAADYDLSAKALNKILEEEKIQRNVGGQWILYKAQMGKGYTKSETFTFTRSDGRLDSKITTKWTQKGRLMIHDILKARGIDAVCKDVM